MVSDDKHLYINIYLLTICMSSLVKCLFRFSAHLKIGLFPFFALELYELLICFGY